MGSRDFEPVEQPTLDQPWRNGAGWNTTFSLMIPTDWPSGIYSAKLTDREGDESHVTFVVKPSSDRRSGLAVLANVNTWLAYNGWGDKSKYGGAARVSFLRPDPGASPVAGRLHLTRGELWILGWLEKEGFQPDVYTDIDFHNGAVHGAYKTLVLSTHPEYWSRDMYQNLQRFLNRGGSLLYLGGNGVFENGEYTADQTGMIFRAGVEEGPRTAALLHRLDPPIPERALLGVATARCGVKGSAYELQRAGVDHLFFQGTNLNRRDTLGAVGLNTGCDMCNGMASGWEVDAKDGTALSGCGVELAGIEDSSHAPDGLIVLAKGIADQGRVGADMTYYEHSQGGFVFSAGSITFGGSLVVDRKIQTIVRNALAEGARRQR